MDITDTLAPNSDQLDAVELPNPRTFTVAKVVQGNDEQPVNVHLAEFPRPWRPGKSMRRVLAHCWGTDATQWVGRRVTLYCDTSVKFGGQDVGGTRIQALSDIKGAQRIPLLVSRGKSAIFTVQPLTEAASAPTPPSNRDDLSRQMVEALGRIKVSGKTGIGEYVAKTLGQALTFDQMTEDDIQTVITAAQQDAEVQS